MTWTIPTTMIQAGQRRPIQYTSIQDPYQRQFRINAFKNQVMKKGFIVLAGMFFLLSCSNNGGESGAVNDGFNGAADSNGGLADTPNQHNTPAIDTSKKEDRV